MRVTVGQENVIVGSCWCPHRRKRWTLWRLQAREVLETMEVMVKSLEDVKSEVWASTEHDGSMGLWGKVVAQGRSLLPEAPG